jgi:DNA-binding transcriptional LysR family regulator
MERYLAFRAVARNRSFSRAAEKLFRTQPAVSQAVRSLEDELDVKLFVRKARGAELTQAGEILFEHVETALGTLDRARARLHGLRGLMEGRLTISASDTTACYMLPEVLRSFREMHPAVEVLIYNRPSPAAAAQVAAHEADIGIVTLPVDCGGLSSERLVAREDVAICAPGHALSRRRRIALRDLTAHPLLLLDKGSNTRAFIDRKLADSGLTPLVAMELGSIEVIKRMVELNFGVSIVPRVAVEAEVARGTLCALAVFGKRECRWLGIVYPRQGVCCYAADVFMQMLRQHVGQRAS